VLIRPGLSSPSSLPVARTPRLTALRAAAALLLAAAPALAAQAAPGIVASPRPEVTRGADARLRARIDSVLARPVLRRADVGVVVMDPADGRVLYARGADRLFVPASVLKLVVSATAAHVLGPDFRHRSTVYADGPVSAGVLRGDLVLAGDGDPTWSGRYGGPGPVLDGIADSLAARGIRSVTGDVVGLATRFDAEMTRGDWEAYDLRWWYAAPVSALGANDNAIDFRVEPGAAPGEPARISATPASDDYALRNETRTVAAGRPHTLDFDRLPGTRVVRAYGEIPLGTAPRTESFAVDDPARWTASLLRDALRRKGIEVAGEALGVYAGRDEAGMTRLFDLASRPLADVIGPILGRSQNWYAEQLVKTVGRRRTGGAGSWEAGLAAERAFLADVVGIPADEVVLRDASGLSAGNLATPSALARLLAYVRATPRQRVVRDALPVSGRSGSLQARLTDLPGRVAAKTGSISGTDALAGYVTAADGRELVFVAVANKTGQPAARVRAALDDVVRAAAAHGR
jgi:D-alanyl-D-alanine carboxypeptidase/D-alanyl-D-alanine-endopeptidase (penicillin-binding protein 4)